MEKIYLHTWINFGKYRSSPRSLKTILDTKEGRNWFEWLVKNSYDFIFDHTVLEYAKLQEENARYVLPTVGSK